MGRGAASIIGSIHGTKEGLAKHTAAGEEPCKDCARGEQKRVAALRARETPADADKVQDFISRARVLMQEQGWTVAELARELETHGETVRLTLNGANWPRKTTLSRLSSRLGELEDSETFIQRRAQEQKAQQAREEHTRRSYARWRQERLKRLQVRTGAPRELVRQ